PDQLRPKPCSSPCTRPARRNRTHPSNLTRGPPHDQEPHLSLMVSQPPFLLHRTPTDPEKSQDLASNQKLATHGCCLLRLCPPGRVLLSSSLSNFTPRETMSWVTFHINIFSFE
ncbi:hypothetical protein S245_010945, partial [Arachis hypogaea]